MIFREWDYTNGTVTTYRRSGECNNCGACCLHVIRFMALNSKVRKVATWDPHNGEFVKASSGRYLEVEHNGHHRYFYGLDILGPERCQMLTEDNKCRIHAGKHLLARAWPLHPDHVEAFPDCSYMFEEVEKRPIAEGE